MDTAEGSFSLHSRSTRVLLRSVLCGGFLLGSYILGGVFICSALAQSVAPSPAASVETSPPNAATPSPSVTTSVEEQSQQREIDRRWDAIYGDQVAEVKPGAVAPATPTPRAPVQTGFNEFSDQFFFRIAVDYVGNFATFTGRPTRTFIENNGPPFTLTPSGNISFPPLFEPTDDKLFSHAVFGTHGLGSSRLHTHVSVVSLHDLNGTTEGSPFISILDSFGARQRTDVENAYFELAGLTPNGWLSNLDVRVGRQYNHSFFNSLSPLGTSVMDGVNFNYRNDRFDFGALVGRRTAFFSDPRDRLVTGATFGARVTPTVYFHYDFFRYTDTGIHTFSVEPQLERPLRLNAYFTLIDKDPVDLGVRAGYTWGRWSLYGTYLEKVSDKSFVYDIFLRAPSQDRFNQVRRLNLGKIAPSSQFTVDVTRLLSSWFSVGGRIWIYELHNENRQGGFDASFQDAAAHLAFFPGRSLDFSAEYRYRNTRRRDPTQATLLDDISRSGETRYHEATGQFGYRFRQRLNAQLGGYYRVFNLQTPFTRIRNSNSGGLFTNWRLRLTRFMDFRFRYGFDNDYLVFNPDINLQHYVRVGFEIHK